MYERLFEYIFPSVPSNVIESYTYFCENMIDTNKVIDVVPNKFVVCQNEIYILDHAFNIYVYDFESCHLLRKFNIKRNFFDIESNMSLMCVNADHIYIYQLWYVFLLFLRIYDFL
jgi:hypothetical protein